MAVSAQIVGRETREASWPRTRELATPRMDHTTRSASGKDSVVDLVKRARVSERNSESRRSRLDSLGADVLRFCRPRPKPLSTNNGDNGQPEGGGSSPFGLRGGPQNGF